MDSSYEYDIYFWLLDNGMDEMLCVTNVTYDQCLKLGAKWIYNFKGDYMLVKHGKMPLAIDSNVTILSVNDLDEYISKRK